MITTRLRQARRLFCNDLTPPAVQRHNMRAWVRTREPMPDDPVLHAAALVYSSDTTLLDSIITTPVTTSR